jgi:hypothetical protein
VLDFALDKLDLKPAPDRTEVLLRCSNELKEAGYSADAIARAGRELRKETQ